VPLADVRQILSRLRDRTHVATDAALVDAAVRLGLSHAAVPRLVAPASGERVERTFLFADIVGSTALLDAMGDEAWAGVRAWFDGTLRRAFAANAGSEVDHTGDGFFVAFDSAAAALACAVEVMRTLDRHRRTTGFAPSVRIGLHTGEARVAGHGYVGRAVHLAARLLAVAEANEIVASIPVIAATGWSAVRPARTLPLKGVSAPVEVVTIRWDRSAG
jgi:class 3 adenylate cyclase